MSKIVTIGAFAVGAAVGATVAYFVTKKKLGDEYDAALEMEIRQSRKYWAARQKADEYATPQSTLNVVRRVPGATLTEMDKANTEIHVGPPVAVLERTLKGLKYHKDEKGEEEPNGKHPYVIAVHQYMSGDLEYEQSTLVYYTQDDVLADSDEQIVTDRDAWIGEASLTKFGLLSNQPEVVYVRNEAMEIDFEVIMNRGSYAEIVHGITKD